MRATPTRRASSSATACASSTRCTARRPTTFLLFPTWPISHSRLLEGAGPVPLAPLPRRHVRPARERPVRPPSRRRGLRLVRSTSPTRSAVLEATRHRTRVVVGLCDGGGWALSSPRPSRAACSASLAIAPVRALGWRRRIRTTASTRPTCRSTPTRAGRSATATTGAATTAASSSSSSPSMLHRAALDEADRGLRRLGARDRRRELIRADEDAPMPWADRGGRPGDVRARALPGARDPRRPRQLPDARAASAVAELTGGTLVTMEGAGHLPAGAAIRCRSTCSCASSPTGRAAGAAVKTWTAGAQPAPSARSTSPRRSGSATPGATSPSRDELRRLHPDLEIDWLAQHPVTAVLEAAGERIHPASALLANESAHIESESAEHDLHAFQAIRRMDEILVANFMVFHDLVARGALRPLDRRRGLGARLLPAREPGAEARGVRLADRLRRLAADGRRRRARGVPDRRLQRRDDRAHRPLPAAARPGGVRRQPGRRRPRLVRARPARRSATGPSSTSTSPAT